MEARTKLGILRAIIEGDQAEQFGFISGDNLRKLILAIIEAEPIGEEEEEENLREERK